MLAVGPEDTSGQCCLQLSKKGSPDELCAHCILTFTPYYSFVIWWQRGAFL